MSATATVLNTKVLVLNRLLPAGARHLGPAGVFASVSGYCARSRRAVPDLRLRQLERPLGRRCTTTPIGLVDRVIRVPRVILLLTYDRVPRRQVRFSRFNIYSRDRNTCQYCGHRFAARRAEPRPRHAALAGRLVALGERRLLVPRAAIGARAVARPRRPACSLLHTAAAPGVDAVHARDLQPAPLSRVAAVPRRRSTRRTGTPTAGVGVMRVDRKAVRGVFAPDCNVDTPRRRL